MDPTEPARPNSTPAQAIPRRFEFLDTVLEFWRTSALQFTSMPSALSLVLAALVAAAPASSELGTSSHPHMDAPTVHALNFDLSRSLAIALPSAAMGITFGTLFAPQTCH